MSVCLSNSVYGCNITKIKDVVLIVRQLRHGFTKKAKVSPNLTVAHFMFIDYTKAFDKLRHDEIMSILDSLNIDGNDLRIVRNKNWEQTAAMILGNDLSAFQDIKRGVRQGCVLSPDLFFIYSE